MLQICMGYSILAVLLSISGAKCVISSSLEVHHSCNATFQNARFVFDILQENSTLKRLDLSYNGFHDAVDILSEVLATNDTITYLDLTANRFIDSDMTIIIKGMPGQVGTR